MFSLAEKVNCCDLDRLETFEVGVLRKVEPLALGSIFALVFVQADTKWKMAAKKNRASVATQSLSYEF